MRGTMREGSVGWRSLAFPRKGVEGRQEEKKQGEQSPSAEDLCIYILIMVS